MSKKITLDASAGETKSEFQKMVEKKIDPTLAQKAASILQGLDKDFFGDESPVLNHEEVEAALTRAENTMLPLGPRK